MGRRLLLIVVLALVASTLGARVPMPKRSISLLTLVRHHRSRWEAYWVRL